MPVPAHLSAFWGEFARRTGGAAEDRFFEAFFFGDSEEMANELAHLVLQGRKRATAAAVRRDFSESMWAVCERFALVYRLATRAAQPVAGAGRAPAAVCRTLSSGVGSEQSGSPRT